MAARKAGGQKAKKQTLRFVLDCSVLVADSLMIMDDFEKFLTDRIKVNGKQGALADVVTLTRDADKVYVASEIPFSKRYLKYLTKKYLKKNNLRDFFHVIATNKQTYQIRYFKIAQEAPEGAEE
uniref:Large ribosomal subunit protein eL22 n=1 Tax=Bicosoecida sp. CB-2014 TaxID=1486930 RepID=A0A6T6YZH5_9STRA|mmetsp:Transcript_6323/g.22522  ORF Transcript_6323/g.22522 Transcript_6323/m.22522 type:complete len:124 (+) Transcript_6323:63-434(+)